MLSFAIGEAFARFLLTHVLPKQWSDRIRDNCSEQTIAVLSTGQTRRKPKIATLIEGVSATLLFDLALFGTDNIMINFFIRVFTKFQNSWDTPFHSKTQAKHQVQVFCQNLSIQQDPWLWEKPPEDCTSLNDFFSRTYHPKHFPLLGSSDIVSPASCTMTSYSDNSKLQSLLIKGCKHQLDEIGLCPNEDTQKHGKHDILIGHLSPSDHHRVHSPVSGKCIHLCLEDSQALSAPVKFFGGKFNLLNNNKRLVLVFEANNSSKEIPLRIALVVVGGVGVNTIVCDNHMLSQGIKKGQEVATFRAGGSAIAMFSNQPLKHTNEFVKASEGQQPVEALVGESLANFC